MEENKKLNEAQNPKLNIGAVRRRIHEWSDKEVECLINYVESNDSETINERLDFARYMLHYESGMGFSSRSMHDVRKKFYQECKRRRG
jgi:hypothetical protein